MKRLYTLSLLLLMCLTSMAQTPSGRSATVTLLKDFEPTVVLMKNGKVNRLRYGNVFMKNSTLVYKQMQNSTVMEANMDVVKQITIGQRIFMNLDNQLAETIDTIGENYLVRVRTVDVETMKAEFLNESNYMNFNIGDWFSFTRDEALDKAEPYPLMDKYYFIIKGKKLLAHERNVRNSLSRKRLDAYDQMIAMGFNWSKKEDLQRMLAFLSE